MAGLLEKKADGTTNYDNQANQTLAKNLKGQLLLAHGTMDNNVPPYNTLLVVNELIKANKDFDLLMLPNRGHGFGNEGYMVRRRWDYFVQVPAGRRAAARVPDALAGGLAPDALDDRPVALDDADQEQHDGNHEQQVNEGANRIGADHAEQPGDQQNHGQCIKHLKPPLITTARNGATRRQLCGQDARSRELPAIG